MTVTTMTHDDDTIGAMLREAASAFPAPDDLKEAVRSAVGRRRTTALRRRAIAAALATVAGAAALVAVLLWPTGPTMAEVRAALEEARWVHIEYDTGDEQWISVANNVYATRATDGSFVFIDYGTGTRWGYRQWSPGVISENSVRAHALEPTIWDQVVGPLERRADELDNPESRWSVERGEDDLDGRAVVRFDQYTVDAVGRRLLVHQLWADPTTRLPVKVRERLQLSDRERLGMEYREGRFEFPDTGPASIYDLGVPRDVPIVRNDPNPAPDAQPIVEAIRAARERFPEHFRQLSWGERGLPVTVHLESGYPHWKEVGEHRLPYYDTVRLRIERFYVEWGDEDSVDLLKTNDPDVVRAWLEGRSPRGSSISDGIRALSREAIPGHPLTVRVMRVARLTLFNQSDWIVHVQWPLYEPPASAPTRLKTEDGSIVLRHRFGDHRIDFTIDPDHDFICIQQHRAKLENGEWVTERLLRLDDFVQLPGGQWIAQRRILDHDRVRHYVVNVVNDGFPPETFDVEAALEQAREDGAVIETY